jgi:hypothetical protein
MNQAQERALSPLQERIDRLREVVGEVGDEKRELLALKQEAAQALEEATRILHQVQASREEVRAMVRELRPAPGFPLLPGLDPVPVSLVADDRKDFAWLYGQLGNVLPTAGGTMSGTLTFSTDSPLNLNNRYTITTSDAGASGHEATGPRLMINNVPDGRTPLLINSLGQTQLYLQDASLDDLTVSHGLQIRRRPTVASQSGIGGGIQFFNADSSSPTADTEVANIQYLMTAVTPGAMTSVMRFRALTGGSNRQVCQMWGDGKIEAVNTTEGGHFQVGSTAFVGSTQHGAFSAGNVAFDGTAGTFSGLAGGTGFAANFSAAYTGRMLDLQLAGVSLVRVSANGQSVYTVSDTANNSPSAPLVLDHKLSSGSPTTGFGSTLTLRTADSSAAAVTGGQIQVAATSVTPGSVTSTVTFQHVKAGATTSAAQISAGSDFLGLFKGLFTGGIGVGNSAAATTLGSVVRKVQIFDAAGASLGFAALYDSIT